jgi:hypothetical protein
MLIHDDGLHRTSSLSSSFVIGRMAIDVPEQAMKIKEKRLFDIIDYQQEVILKLEDSETPMRGPHFKAMLVRVSSMIYDV